MNFGLYFPDYLFDNYLQTACISYFPKSSEGLTRFVNCFIFLLLYPVGVFIICLAVYRTLVYTISSEICLVVQNAQLIKNITIYLLPSFARVCDRHRSQPTRRMQVLCLFLIFLFFFSCHHNRFFARKFVCIRCPLPFIR